VELGRALASARPDWGSELSEIEVLSDEDFRLYIAALPFPVLVRFTGAAGELAAALERLASLAPDLAARYGGVESVDLRGGRRVIVRPAAAA
jgi:hypothetical protein